MKDDLQILMQRAIDGNLSVQERTELARVLDADPVRRAEYEELLAVHAATDQLFRQISLPANFSQRVMSRIQGADVPSDALQEDVRLPRRRSIGRRRASVARMHRRTVRTYGAFAGASTFAALILAVVVVIGSFEGGRGQPAGPNDSNVHVSRGGPGADWDQRTNPTGMGVEEGEASAPETDTEASLVTAPRSIVNQPSSSNRSDADSPIEPAAEVDSLESDDRPRSTRIAPAPVVPQSDLPEPNQSDLPREAVENEPVSRAPTARLGGATESEPLRARELGKLTVLAGRAEVLGRDGNWTRMSDDQAVSSGARLRTNVNGVAMVQLSNGTLILGRGAEVQFEEDHDVALFQGELTVERGVRLPGGDFRVRCDDLTVSVEHGCSVIMRRRRGASIRVAMGFAAVFGEQGTLLLESSRETDVEFGRAFGEPRESRSPLPDWSGEARASSVLASVDKALLARDWRPAERAYVDRNLSAALRRLMRFPVSAESMTSFLEVTITNAQLDGRAVCRVVGDIESAFVEEAAFTQTELLIFAEAASRTAEDFAGWQQTFRQFIRPQLPPTRSRPAAPAGQSDDCPDSDRVRRVDRPPPRQPRRIGEDQPAKDLPERGN